MKISAKTADIGASGFVDGTGQNHPEGSYVRIRVEVQGQVNHYHLSRGAAEILASEITTLLEPVKAEEK